MNIVKLENRKLKLNEDLLWESDWNGDEVGYDEVSVVGLYREKDKERYFYIDMETMEILEVWENYENE